MKKQNGITLIALVITIIVLLILAGVSISTIMGDNGLIAKAKAAGEKTKQAQLDEYKALEDLEMAIDGAKLKYEVEQKGAYATIKLYIAIDESNTYGDYAVEKLYGKNEADKAEMFLMANNYYAELNQSEHLQKHDTVEELVAFYGSQEDAVHYGATTMDEIVKLNGYNNISDLLIDWGGVDPEGAQNLSFGDEKEFDLKVGNALLLEDASTAFPYVEINVSASGTYEFTLIPENGKTSTIKVPVQIASKESVFLFETNDSGELEILGLSEEYYGSTVECYGASPFSVLTIPSKYNGEEVKSIGNQAFSNLENLVAVYMPDTIEIIGEEAFAGNFLLQDIKWSNSLKVIGKLAFYECDSLEKVILPDSLEIIDENAFYQCWGLKEVYLPDSLTTIRNSAFRNCSDLTEIFIPASVITMEADVIQGQTLATVYCEATSQPDTWDTDWCNSSRTIEWGCTR